MAMNLKALNIGLGKGKADAKPASKDKPAKKGASAAASTTFDAGKKAATGFALGGSSFRSRMQALMIAVGFLVLVIAAVGLLAIRTTSNGTAYISSAGQMRMLSQRLAKESQQGLQGSAEAFVRLKKSRDEFAGLVDVLANGGAMAGIDVPASSESAKPALDKVTQVWQKTDKNVNLVIAQQKSLVQLGNAVKAINANNPVLLDLAEQVSALKLQSQAGSREISLAGQLVMLTQRMAKNANALLASDVIDPEVTFLLGKDSNTFRDILQGLTKGSDSLRISAARDPETVEKLKELDTAYGEYRQAVNSILGSLQPLVNAKAAGRSVVTDSRGAADRERRARGCVRRRAYRHEMELHRDGDRCVRRRHAGLSDVEGLPRRGRATHRRAGATAGGRRTAPERGRGAKQGEPGSHSPADERDGQPRRR